jgi:phosphatidylinositol alpha-1,6-mannosyltransferase
MAGRTDLLFAFDFPPMDGGIARLTEAIAREYPPGQLIVSTGSWPDAATMDATFNQRIDRIPVPATRLRTVPGRLAWSRRAVSLARDPAVRFAWCDTARPSGVPAWWACRRTGLPYGIIVVGGDLLTMRPGLARSAFKRRLVRAVLGRAAAFVAISQWSAALCREVLADLHLESAESRVRVVTLGTDPARWQPDRQAADEFRLRRNLPDARWLVTVARLVDYKGIDTAIRLLASLAAGYPDLHYAVIGRGEQESVLRTLAAELGIGDRVHLLTDVGDDELAAAYSIGEIYLGLTRETSTAVEGFGISFVEAAACGLPVVATRSGGIPDAVVDGVTGILTDPGDVGGARDAVLRLLASAELRNRMGSAGRNRVEYHHNWRRVVADLRTIATELGRPAPPNSGTRAAG